MAIIVDWYGQEQEIDPALFANEEYRYPKEYGSRNDMLKVRDIIQYCGYDDTYDFWATDDGPAHYMYNRIAAEVELYLGWRVNNGYHIKTISCEDIEDALDSYTSSDKSLDSSLIKVFQFTSLNSLVFDVDQAFFILNATPKQSIYKTILFVYAFCVKNQPPHIALEACRSSDALSYLKKYPDISGDTLWKKVMDERIETERNKLNLKENVDDG